MDLKFFVCRHCGNIIAYVHDSGVKVMCCGEPMQELVPGTVDASHEKHIPTFKVEGNKVTVTVGSVEHPMTAEHHIEWVALHTKHGNQRKALEVGKAPTVSFLIDEDDEVIAVYAYCNLHGLWKATK